MSAKKDALVNIGGFLSLSMMMNTYEASNLVVVYEGLHSMVASLVVTWKRWPLASGESVSDEHMKAVWVKYSTSAKNCCNKEFPL